MHLCSPLKTKFGILVNSCKDGLFVIPLINVMFLFSILMYKTILSIFYNIVYVMYNVPDFSCQLMTFFRILIKINAV